MRITCCLAESSGAKPPIQTRSGRQDYQEAVAAFDGLFHRLIPRFARFDVQLVEPYFHRGCAQGRAVGQTAEQRVVVAFQPAAESTKVTPFERKQNPNRDDLTGIQSCLRDFLHLPHLIIDTTKDVNDNLFMSSWGHAPLASTPKVCGVLMTISTCTIGSIHNIFRHRIIEPISHDYVRFPIAFVVLQAHSSG